MSQKAWKPIRLSGSAESKKVDKSSATILVELVIYNEEVKKTFRGVLDAHPEFRVKDIKEPDVPRLVILELDEDPKESFAFVETVVQSVSGREVWLTSPRTEANVLLESIRAGVKEFFPQPVNPDEVGRALEKFSARCKEATQASAKKVGDILCVFGGKGGVGTTTFAVNLALGLQRANTRRSVALVEINQQAGDLPLFLDLRPPHSLKDIGSDLSRLDAALLTRLLCKHDSGLHVLSSGYDDLSSGRLPPECVEPTLKLLQSIFDFVVVDCGHVLDLTAKKTIELSTSIIVVSSLIVPIVHRTKRILDLLKSSGMDSERVKLVFNRYSSDEKEILHETEDALKFKCKWVVPNDYVAASGAVNNGTPVCLFAPKSQVAKCYQEIAASLTLGPKARKESVPLVERIRNIMLKRSKPTQAQAS